MEPNIRVAQREDLSSIIRIESICYANPWPNVLFEGHLGERGFMVYEIDGILCGYIIVGIKIPTLFQRIEKRTRALAGQEVNMNELAGHLMNIAVLPEFRRQGIGKELLTLGIGYLSQLGAESIELEVRQSNIAAIAMYEQFGFVPVRNISNYYNDGEVALLMRKIL